MGISISQGLDKSIFRAYDIRGKYPAELDETGAYKIARAIFEYAKPKRVAVGRDCRLAAPIIHRAVCQGFADVGCEVVDCGITGSDMMAWLAGAQDFDITINVSASHNPKEWIGLKINQRGGGTVGGAGEIQEISDIAIDINEELVTKNEEFVRGDFLQDWVRHILSFADPAAIKPFKIVVDASNGVAGPIVRELFQHLPVKLVEMYFEPDGNFPHHLPSPIEPKNVVDLQKRVIEEGADLGIIFDGDADRVFLVDELGQWVNGSETTAMVMDAILAQDSSRVVLHNEICGWNVRDVIMKHSATAHPTLTGIGFIKKDMVKRDAYFCGEHSGHYYFKENYNCDSGLIATVFVLTLLSKRGGTLSRLLAEYRKYVSIPEINFRVQNIDKAIETIADKYRSGRVTRFDGITIEFDDFWFNVRPSSTEPLLRLNVEAKSKEVLDEKAKELIGLIESLA